MTERPAMPPARQPRVPGMTPAGPESAPPRPAPSSAQETNGRRPPGEARNPRRRSNSAASTNGKAQPAPPPEPARWPARDYSSTRLVNMRLPVDLHERHKDLLREVERRFPRLRNPSLTEYVIGLLEESEPTPDGMAAVIRRKRVDQSARS